MLQSVSDAPSCCVRAHVSISHPPPQNALPKRILRGQSDTGRATGGRGELEGAWLVAAVASVVEEGSRVQIIERCLLDSASFLNTGFNMPSVCGGTCMRCTQDQSIQYSDTCNR